MTADPLVPLGCDDMKPAEEVEFLIGKAASLAKVLGAAVTERNWLEPGNLPPLQLVAQQIAASGQRLLAQMKPTLPPCLEAGRPYSPDRAMAVHVGWTRSPERRQWIAARTTEIVALVNTWQAGADGGPVTSKDLLATHGLLEELVSDLVLFGPIPPA
jgi:hypothetical protein